VVHRDIKPSNIMVTARGSVKVMDFGVARATFDSREAATRSQQYGTARYMAPERWLEGVAGAPSDVFSLGVTLIELLGAVDVERPRLSKEGFRADIEAALSALDPWPAVRELAEQMCAYDPEARPTAAEVAERCRSLEHDQPAPGLREWAAGWVPTADHRPAPDPRDGSVVCEDTGSTTYDFSSADTADLDASASSFAPTERVSGTVARFRSRRLAFIGGFVAAACLAVGLTVLRPAADPERASVDEGSPDPIATMEPGPTTTEVPARGGDAADEPPEPVDMPTATPVEPVATRPEPAQPVTTRPEPAQPAGGAVPPTEAGARTVEPDPKASPTPAPPAEDPPPTSYVTFIVRPPDLKVSAHGQAIHSRRAVELPLGVHEVSVTDGASQWTCTVVVDDVPRTWRIEGAKRQCTQAS